jgi:hypothetical protein
MKQTVYNFNRDTRYLTRGVSSEVPIEVQVTIWELIDKLIVSDEKVDYLQVFRFEYKNDRFFIHHSQEQPHYQKSYEYDMRNEYYPLTNKKIFVIDDVTHSTMLFANEY